MEALPKIVRDAWEEREGPVVLATIDEAGAPNIIYATCVAAFGDNQLIVADNYFNKTRANVIRGCPGAILFITRDGKAYQVKGALSYHKDGEAFDNMKSWNSPQHPGHAAAVLTAEEAYSGGQKLE